MKHNLYFDDVIYSLQRYGGISTFWNEITSRVAYKSIFNIIRKKGSRCSKYFPVAVNEGIFHSSYYRLPSNNKVKSVVTIHDFICELGFLKQVHSFINISHVKSAIHRANILVCVSESTKKDLLSIYPLLVKNSDIYVIPHGTTFSYTLSHHIVLPARLSFIHELRTKFLLFVGRRSSYKNFYTALQAFTNSKLPSHGIKLICIGQPLTKIERKLIRDLNLTSNILCISNVSTKELSYLYHLSFAMLYPSLYEGFGLPPLEAMSCGCPVVASNNSAIPEVVGDAGLLVDPSDIDAMSSALNQLLDPNVRNSFREKGLARAKLFSWDIAAEKYLKLYQSLI